MSETETTEAPKKSKTTAEAKHEQLLERFGEPSNNWGHCKLRGTYRFFEQGDEVLIVDPDGSYSLIRADDFDRKFYAVPSHYKE